MKEVVVEGASAVAHRNKPLGSAFGCLTFLVLAEVDHLQMWHGQRHHLPQGQSKGEDVGLVGDLASLLQGLLWFPRLSANVVRRRVGH